MYILPDVRRPAKMYVTTRMMRDRRRVYRSIRRRLGKDNYRKDLIEVQSTDDSHMNIGVVCLYMSSINKHYACMYAHKHTKRQV